jgi:hypothetical protein
MKTLIYSLLLLAFVACQQAANPDTIQPEYADWYTMRSPDNRSIEAVWGDIDNTVVISTMFNLYRSVNKGRDWEAVFSISSGMMGLTNYRDTLFVTTGTRSDGYYSQLINPTAFSVDLGKSWSAYRRFNPVFDLSGYSTVKNIYNNPVTAANGETYRIWRQYLDDSTKSSRRFITPGVVTKSGRRIDVPKLHQLSTLALDSKGRLYVAGSDEVCGLDPSFRFCNGGRGVVYVSKRALP